MDNSFYSNKSPGLRLVMALVVLTVLGALIFFSTRATVRDTALTPAGSLEPGAAVTVAAIKPTDATPRSVPTVTPTATASPTRTATPTPSNTPTPTVTPTPTLDLAGCNVSGCGAAALPLPTVEYEFDLLLRYEPFQRRVCAECPANERLSPRQLDQLLATSDDTLARLEQLALSQQPYQVAPGIVYIVNDNVHHVVIDLEERGFILRNIIPPASTEEERENVRITPSYCFNENTLLVTDGDFHGLVGSNKTEGGREVFFHLGRAALYNLDGRYDIGVIREYDDFARTAVAWGGGPLFIWDGRYNFNPEQEWFDDVSLDYYQTNKWAKISAAISQDRKYLFLTASYGLTLEQHASNIIELARRWGITIERALRFDGTENTFMAIKMGDALVPLLQIDEPLIVNCFAVERAN